MLNRIFLASLLLGSTTLFAQSKRPSISFNPGLAVPIGNFGGSDEPGSKNGFAKAGPQFNIGINWPLDKRFGIEVMVHGQLNPLDTKGLAKAFHARPFYSSIAVGSADGTVPMLSGPAARYENWKFEKHDWQMAGIMAGPTLNLQINDKVSFTAKAMAGGMLVSKPRIAGKSESPTDVAAFLQYKESGFGFSYGASAAIKWRISNRVSLVAGVNYLGIPEVTFKDVTTAFSTSSSGGVSTINSQAVTFKQSISSLNFHVGIVIRL